MDRALVERVEDRVRDAVRRSGIDPIRDRDAIRRAVDEAVVAEALDGAQAGIDTHDIAQQVHDRVAGFGPLQPFFDDPEVEEVWINEPGRVFIARSGRSELTTTVL
ncbi:MAG: CpaF family protein, partial [Actinomycetota bacterium]